VPYPTFRDLNTITGGEVVDASSFSFYHVGCGVPDCRAGRVPRRRAPGTWERVRSSAGPAWDRRGCSRESWRDTITRPRCRQALR
jgi:hypothetical protein